MKEVTQDQAVKIIDAAVTKGWDYFEMGKKVKTHHFDHNDILTIEYLDGSSCSQKIKADKTVDANKFLTEPFAEALYGKSKGKQELDKLKKDREPFKTIESKIITP